MSDPPCRHTPVRTPPDQPGPRPPAPGDVGAVLHVMPQHLAAAKQRGHGQGQEATVAAPGGAAGRGRRSGGRRCGRRCGGRVRGLRVQVQVRWQRRGGGLLAEGAGDGCTVVGREGRNSGARAAGAAGRMLVCGGDVGYCSRDGPARGLEILATLSGARQPSVPVLGPKWRSLACKCMSATRRAY